MNINISDIRRQTSLLGKAVLKEIGDKFAAELWQEFDTLVVETPQWSGTAAASWNMALGRSGGGVRTQPRVKDVKQALRKGHMAAVGVALDANAANLSDISKRYRYADIVVWNDAPSAEKAEYGPLRGVNSPGRAFVSFKNRVKDMSISLGDHEL